METKILPSNHPASINTTLDALLDGSLVAFPTDTVYGLGSLVTLPHAIEQLFVVKGRDASKAIAVLIGDPAALAQVTAEMSHNAQRLAQQFWPGALTLVVKRHPDLPDNLSPLPTVGVRMPDHPVALSLLKKAGPMAVTSANLSGQPSASSAQEVFEQLAGQIPIILDGGKTPGGVPSTVVDCTKDEPVILRAGPISLEAIRAALEK